MVKKVITIRLTPNPKIFKELVAVLATFTSITSASMEELMRPKKI